MTEAMTKLVQDGLTNPMIEIADGQYLVRFTNQQGCVQEKFVAPEAIVEAFANVPIDTGWLPPEIRRTGRHRGLEWALAFMPPRRYTLEVSREGADGQQSQVDRLTIPLPGLVCFGIKVDYFVWAVKTDHLEPYHEIYRAPLSNLYQDGRVCWGDLQPPRSSPLALLQAFNLFMGTTFNNHLAKGRSKREGQDVRVMLRELSSAGCDRYPVDDLMRQVRDVGVTLDKAIRVFFETGEIPS
ncbi:MAG TPA: hypothetical protein VF735_08970 [Pyrinomonadaceae bacterium]|jgi:hypothetical protein